MPKAISIKVFSNDQPLNMEKLPEVECLFDSVEDKSSHYFKNSPSFYSYLTLHDHFLNAFFLFALKRNT